MSADEVGLFLLAAAFSLIKRDKLPLISLISSTFCFHSALLTAVSFAHASTKKMQQGSDCAMTTLVCVAKSVMQYQWPSPIGRDCGGAWRCSAVPRSAGTSHWPAFGVGVDDARAKRTLSMIELVGDSSHPFADCGCRPLLCALFPHPIS